MEADELLHIHSMLHLIFHRNRNQHGRTKWWKWLSILKRTVWNLVISVQSSDAGASRSSAESYKRYLSDRILPRCYVAFSVVVADLQFSALGTVLLATLARLAKSTGIDKELKSASWIEDPRKHLTSLQSKTLKDKEDIGEALSRPEGAADNLGSPKTHQKLQRSSEDIADTGSRKSTAAKTSDATKAKKKKKKVKKNAIDDLFDGLM
ncbi:hypothetical protein BDV18DRAFT_72992 [Aspergillus unguis]